MKYGSLIFTEERREFRQAHHWNSYVRSDVLRSEYSEGHWIMSGDTKKSWDQCMNDKKAATAKKRDLWEESDDVERVTECASISTFAYKECIAKQYTIDMMDKNAVIEAFSPFFKHPHIMDPSMDWEELSDKTKRGCSYQHYHSNFFRSSKGECSPLPWCIEKYIKQCYGGAGALYTGFKTKRQRAAEKYAGKKAKKITMLEAKIANKRAFSKSKGKENEVSSSNSE
ncbi:hypothetical protein SEMRO_1735_G294360.1 [Seminavis robusta]|uniref:Uncharacterized protein n=1 Tax=Seminavis robusta TaxID=568900 RepID=A0A9N8ESZ7_9STRA|nr:hypothetical protein SEMRO_1735_G294360.1 [Seminavis robusta]|eukprot:Sro1735_g294360.1 n/a (227) ;mRNA; f:17935-18615